MDTSYCKSELELLSKTSDLSLFKLINFTRTKGGEELLKSWITTPLNDIDDINSRLDQVEYFGQCSERMDLMNKLKKVPEMGQVIEKFSVTDMSNLSGKGEIGGKNGTKLEHCVKLYFYSKAYLEVLNLLESSPYFYQEMLENKENSLKIQELVTKSIDINSKSLDHEFRIIPDFDPNLREIHEQIEFVDSRLEELRIESKNKLGLSKELSLIQSQAHGLLFEGNKKEIHAGFRSNPSQNYVIVSHLQTTVKITCPELKNLSNEKIKLTEEYMGAQIDLEYKIIEMIVAYRPYIEETLKLLSYLDGILSLAHASFSSVTPYCRPIFNTDGRLELKACRHPCLELNQNCVPNDVTMVRHMKSLILITGPNMGGKTTYLRQVALCVILAHIGCFVPADSANVCIVDKVMVRIGAYDSQLSGMSTFMNEMVEVAAMTENATENSLLIIDELGRGTSTSEGLGIAWALCDYFSKLGCFTLFATHLSKLTSLPNKNIALYYTDVVIGEDNVEMRYKIIPGVIPFSFGIEIASLTGIPESIIQKARDTKKEKEDLVGCLKSLNPKEIITLYNSL